MCRWIAYIGSPISPERFLFEEQFSLVEQSQHARKSKSIVNGDGFGLGWYAKQRTPGLFRDVLPAWNDENLHSLAYQIEASMFMAHVRAATDTSVTRANCHPFAHQEHLFMHNGQIGGYLLIRRLLESLLENELFGFRLGNTDSEILFLLLVQFGAKTNFPEAVSKLILTLQEILAAQQISKPFRFTAAFTNGKVLYAIRYASDHNAPTLFFRHTPTGCLVASEPLDEDQAEWTSLPQNQILMVQTNGEVKDFPLQTDKSLS